MIYLIKKIILGINWASNIALSWDKSYPAFSEPAPGLYIWIKRRQLILGVTVFKTIQFIQNLTHPTVFEGKKNFVQKKSPSSSHSKVRPLKEKKYQ